MHAFAIFVFLPCIVLVNSGILLQRHRATLEKTLDVGGRKIRLSESPAKLERAQLQESRADEVREALRHLWSGYKRKGWGADEVKPISGEPSERYGKVGMLILDTLDTLWLAGLHTEFAEAERWVSEFQLKPLRHSMRTAFFEITIRGLAGLLSAYALSGHPVFRDKARLLGDQLLQGFPKPGSDHLWPVATIDVHNVSDVEVAPINIRYLAGVGSNVMEFGYLSDATGNSQYRLAAEKVFNQLVNLSVSTSRPLPPVELDPYSLKFSGGTVSVGAWGDSYFEYLLKRYLQGGCKEPHLLSAWKGAMREMKKSLIRQSSSGLTYVHSNKAGWMEHLSCFVGGMLAIASRYVPAEESEAWWLPTGIELTRTCYEMYHQMPSGLAPEKAIFSSSGVHSVDAHYRLRPETLESLFYLHRITRNETYREWSWNIFKAINSRTKSEYGFAEVQDVTNTSSLKEDREESWMGAETLKYALLTQLPATALSLDAFVFNTEAHPFPAAQTCSQI